MTTANSPYTETLGQALEAIRAEMEAKRAVVAPINADWLETFSMGGLAYNQTKEAHAELESLKGKKTWKFAHATIYRLDSGRYEWLVYFL